MTSEWAEINAVDALVEKGHDPQHAMYLSAQNILSTLIQSICVLKEFDKLNKVVETAEEQYSPSWPPMSPISNSCHFTWSCFDVRVGLDKESYLTCLLDLRRTLGLSDFMCHIFTLFDASRLGVYEVVEHSGTKVLLEEIYTRKRYRCISASPPEGCIGQLWLVRILPPITDHFDDFTVFTSPYVLTDKKTAWLQFFDRSFIKGGLASKQGYENFMECGLSHFYWVEYIFQAYSAHTAVSIDLSGFPDKGESRPHFFDNSILPEETQA